MVWTIWAVVAVVAVLISREHYGANVNLLGTDSITITAPGGQFGGTVVDQVMLTAVPEPATLIAGALVLLPFAFSTIQIIRRNRSAHEES